MAKAGTWHTGSRGACCGDADTGRPRLPRHAPCAGRRQTEQETAAWSFPMAAVGDGSVTHEARSGGGPGEGFLADTGRGNGRWVCRQLQMLEDLPDDLAVRDGGDEPHRPPLTPGAARHVKRKDPLEQPCPAPARRSRVGRLLVHALLAWRRDDRPHADDCAAPDSRHSAPGGRAAGARARPASPRVPTVRAECPWSRRTTGG